jgi:hypothetical protein
MNELAQFLTYSAKVFGLKNLWRKGGDSRPHPLIPTQAIFLSLLLGVIIRCGSYLELSQQTKRRRWQHLVHYCKAISDDAFDYLCERTVQP